jgi:hypothetical protein
MQSILNKITSDSIITNYSQKIAQQRVTDSAVLHRPIMSSSRPLRRRYRAADGEPNVRTFCFLGYMKYATLSYKVTD